MANATSTGLISRLCNRPLLVEARIALLVTSVLSERFGIAEIELDGELVSIEAGMSDAQSQIRDDREYRVVDGIAHVPIYGSLVQRSRFLRPMSGATGYTAIDAQLRLAREDADVRAIVLDIDSGGGEVAGAFQAAASIASAAREKPVVAMANERALSAAFLLASGATRIVAPPGGDVGSIGVIAVMLDMSKAIERKGIRAHVIRAGDRKARGNEIEGPDERSLERVQASVNDIRARFAAFVADARGITLDAVLGTEAESLSAEEGLELGLVDEIITSTDDAVVLADRLAGKRSAVGRSNGGALMSENTKTQKAGTDTGAETEAPAINVEAMVAAGVAAERKRIAGILDHDEAKDRASLARHLALTTELSVEQAGGILAAASKEAAVTTVEAPGTGFKELMDSVDNPPVSGVPRDKADADAEEERAMEAAMLSTSRRKKANA